MLLNEDGMRTRITEFLPRALETALDSYRKFTGEGKEHEDAKGFKEHHDACKVALAHIELLLKLAKLADLPPPHVPDEDKDKLLQTIIENGRKELGRI